MFFSPDTLVLDTIQFIKNFRLFSKQIQFFVCLFVLIPFLSFGPPHFIDYVASLLISVQFNFTRAFITVWLFFAKLWHIIEFRDGPNLLFWAFGIIYFEARLMKKVEPGLSIVTGQEFLARRILFRDRIFAFLGYYVFSQQFFDHFRVYLKLHKVPEVYFFKCMRLWVKQHWAAQSYLSFNLPLLIPFFNVIIYRQIVRRRNGYDTIWLDHFKRFEWHGGKIPPLKHFVRYNWGVAWLLDVFSTLIIEVFDVSACLIDREVGLLFQPLVISSVYYAGATFYLIGGLCSLLGLRAWCPPLHRPVSNQVGLYNPPGRIQPLNSQFQEDFDPLDNNNKYYKFRF